MAMVRARALLDAPLMRSIEARYRRVFAMGNARRAQARRAAAKTSQRRNFDSEDAIMEHLCMLASVPEDCDGDPACAICSWPAMGVRVPYRNGGTAHWGCAARRIIGEKPSEPIAVAQMTHARTPGSEDHMTIPEGDFAECYHSEGDDAVCTNAAKCFARLSLGPSMRPVLAQHFAEPCFKQKSGPTAGKVQKNGPTVGKPCSKQKSGPTAGKVQKNGHTVGKPCFKQMSGPTAGNAKKEKSGPTGTSGAHGPGMNLPSGSKRFDRLLFSLSPLSLRSTALPAFKIFQHLMFFLLAVMLKTAGGPLFSLSPFSLRGTALPASSSLPRLHFFWLAVILKTAGERLFSLPLSFFEARHCRHSVHVRI